ncbi:hypothetical protein HDZ31DRAFT_50351 [Schizophyllum fasciatum]
MSTYCLSSIASKLSPPLMDGRPRLTNRKTTHAPRTVDVPTTVHPNHGSPPQDVHDQLYTRVQRLCKLTHRTEAIVQETLVEESREGDRTCYTLRLSLTSLLFSLAHIKQTVAEHHDLLPEATDEWCTQHLQYVDGISHVLNPFARHDDFDVSLSWLQITAEKLHDSAQELLRSYRKLMYHHLRRMLHALRQEASAARAEELVRRTAYASDEQRRSDDIAQVRLAMRAYKEACRTPPQSLWTA